ncbi:MAG: 4Fe-4S dicluster domain-containing protein [Chloroflexi bacterium]|nr:4Fe-4S dicluster domain-containing protein [Chloroflexota bacterium]
MARWGMIIDLDKCTACQACTIACRFENNVPFQGEEETRRGHTRYWNEVLSQEVGKYPMVKVRMIPRPCMHCDNPPCVQVCPVGATYKNQEGTVLQKYERCIGCRYCMVACPYGARFFNWKKPEFPEVMGNYTNPNVPIRPKGVVEKCTFCIQRVETARAEAKAAGRELMDGDVVPACVQTCTGRARYFGDLDDPNSQVYQLSRDTRATRLAEELGTKPKVYYLAEG